MGTYLFFRNGHYALLEKGFVLRLSGIAEKCRQWEGGDLTVSEYPFPGSLFLEGSVYDHPPSPKVENKKANKK